jgi:hypothetical protein
MGPEVLRLDAQCPFGRGKVLYFLGLANLEQPIMLAMPCIFTDMPVSGRWKARATHSLHQQSREAAAGN